MNIVQNNQLTFHNVALSPAHGVAGTWLTSADIAKALGYKSTKSISNLFTQYEDEFTPGMTMVIESMTNGINGASRRLKVRVFSLRGSHLIAMFARTPVAKEFRRWVLDILDREAQSQNVAPMFSGKVLLNFEDGELTMARVANEDEHLMSAKTMMELLHMRGYITVTKDELAQKVMGAIKNLQ